MVRWLASNPQLHSHSKFIPQLQKPQKLRCSPLDSLLSFLHFHTRRTATALFVISLGMCYVLTQLQSNMSGKDQEINAKCLKFKSFSEITFHYPNDVLIKKHCTHFPVITFSHLNSSPGAVCVRMGGVEGVEEQRKRQNINLSWNKQKYSEEEPRKKSCKPLDN